MDLKDVRELRLANQRLTLPIAGDSADVVAWMGAMQAQEYPMAKWAIGLRLADSVEPDIEAAFQSGQILRTHVLRPTWHFVTPRDIRWLLQLTGPHVQRRAQRAYRELELTPAVLSRTCRVFERELGDGSELTRKQLGERLARAGIEASGRRLGYILMNAELEGVICSGAKAGKQFTYALLDHKAPTPTTHDRTFDRESALAELATRYFSSRGPATVNDFAYWSGLSMADARLGARLLDASFAQATVAGKAYWYRPLDKQAGSGRAADRPVGSARPIHASGSNDRATFLMPDYDEYVMGYRDRTAIMPAVDGRVWTDDAYPSADGAGIAADGAGIAAFDAFRQSPLGIFDLNTYNHWLVLDGRIQGTWQYANARKSDVMVRILQPDGSVGDVGFGEATGDLATGLDRFRAFWQMPDPGRSVPM